MDPVAALAHDHADINRRVRALGAAIARLRQDPDGLPSSVLVVAIEELREQLFLHFAREEEGLFPFVSDMMPDLLEAVGEMATAHDTICGTIARMHHLAITRGEMAAIAALFERFELAYAGHSQREATLLSELDARLGADHRTHLARLVDGL